MYRVRFILVRRGPRSTYGDCIEFFLFFVYPPRWFWSDFDFVFLIAVWILSQGFLLVSLFSSYSTSVFSLLLFFNIASLFQHHPLLQHQFSPRLQHCFSVSTSSSSSASVFSSSSTLLFFWNISSLHICFRMHFVCSSNYSTFLIRWKCRPMILFMMIFLVMVVVHFYNCRHYDSFGIWQVRRFSVWFSRDMFERWFSEWFIELMIIIFTVIHSSFRNWVVF